jgi:hypothetical protein
LPTLCKAGFGDVELMEDAKLTILFARAMYGARKAIISGTPDRRHVSTSHAVLLCFKLTHYEFFDLSQPEHF